MLLHCHIQPKSSENRIVGWMGDALRIKLTSPPIEGRANKALIRFLAREFNLPRGDIAIVKGERSRLKTVSCAKTVQIPPRDNESPIDKKT